MMTAVLEIRTYRLRPGSGAAFHRTVVEESVPMLERWGVDVVAFGPSLDDDDAYYLIRSYASLEERQHSQDAFYGSDEWRHGPREAIVSRIESDSSVVLPADSRCLTFLRRPWTRAPESQLKSVAPRRARARNWSSTISESTYRRPLDLPKPSTNWPSSSDTGPRVSVHLGPGLG
jgi:hypothetical protein